MNCLKMSVVPRKKRRKDSMFSHVDDDYDDYNGATAGAYSIMYYVI